ncbi:hypothetical protein OG21DRAFT_1527618 [Imleria badia]|nr:hypothetical protein OG21DRAFT_1527618 [Imleria badia]
MGLSSHKVLYNVLCDTVRKLVTKYLDTSCTLSRQKDKLLIEKVIMILKVAGQFTTLSAVSMQPISTKTESISANEGRDSEAEDKEPTTTSTESEKEEPVKVKTSKKGKSKTKVKEMIVDVKGKSKLKAGIEPTTSCIGRLHSTIELLGLALEGNSDIRADLSPSDNSKSHETSKGKEKQQDNDEAMAAVWFPLPSMQVSSTKPNACHEDGTSEDAGRVKGINSTIQSLLGGPSSQKAIIKVDPKPTPNLFDGSKSTNSNSSEDEEDQDRFPKGHICPGISCTDEIPPTVSSQLAGYLARYKELYQANGRSFTLCLGADICVCMAKEYRRLDALKLATKYDWPITSIDFTKIPSRVHAMFSELNNIIFNRDAQTNLHVWTWFEGDLEGEGWTLKLFARVPPSKIPMNSIMAQEARPG